MTDFIPTPEAVEAVAEAMWGGDDWEAAGRCYPWNPEMEDCQEAMRQVRVGIAAFVEQERKNGREMREVSDEGLHR